MMCACCSKVTQAPCHPIEPVSVAIPAALLEPCDNPARMQIETNADLVRMLSNTIQAFETCKARHAALVMAIDKGE